MPSIDRGTAYSILSSEWGGLSDHLIAKFFPVEDYVVEGDQEKTKRWRRIPNSVEVRAPITEGRMETTLNWTSPFENVGAEQKLSMVSSMLQSGGFTALLDGLREWIPTQYGKDALTSAMDTLKSMENRSGFTRMNSRQNFSGMPPSAINVTAHFRALTDPITEVRMPVNQLMSWALPQKLKNDGVVTGVLNRQYNAFGTDVPQIIGMQYADMLLLPLVMEAIPIDLTVPRDARGNKISEQIVLSLATLTAIDKNDWTSSFT